MIAINESNNNNKKQRITRLWAGFFRQRVEKLMDNHHQRGQSLVEMAIVLPILLIVLLGVVEVSYYMYANISVRNTAREAARVAIKETSDHNINDWTTLVISDVVKSATGSFLQPTSANDTVIVTKVKVDLDGSVTCYGPQAGSWPDGGGQGPDSTQSQFSDCSSQFAAKIAQMPGDLGQTSGLTDDVFLIVEYFHRHYPIIGLTVAAPDGVTLYSSSIMRFIGQ